MADAYRVLRAEIQHQPAYQTLPAYQELAGREMTLADAVHWLATVAGADDQAALPAINALLQASDVAQNTDICQQVASYALEVRTGDEIDDRVLHGAASRVLSGAAMSDYSYAYEQCFYVMRQLFDLRPEQRERVSAIVLTVLDQPATA